MKSETKKLLKIASLCLTFLLITASVFCLTACDSGSESGSKSNNTSGKSEPEEVREIIVEGQTDEKYVSYRVYKIVTCEEDPSLVGKFLISSGNWDKYLDKVKIGTTKCTCETTEYNMIIMVSQDEDFVYTTVWDYIGDKVVCTEDEVKAEFATKKDVKNEIDWTEITK